MIVGTATMKSTRCSLTNRRNSAASNRGISTRCCRINSPIVAVVMPVLWLSGTAISWVSPSWRAHRQARERSREAAVAAGLDELGPTGAAP